uniref:Beta-lactamase-related domain-containing protein n=1 Tax=Psilocybe cubensis TaxID=181762 RepID=A0A8H7XU60_PSICU
MTSLSTTGKVALTNYIKETLQSKTIPGFVLGVSNINEEIFFEGGGSRIVDDIESGEITPDSIFWICSQTKMITALAVLKLIENGTISLDTPVGNFIPEFRNPIIVDKTSTRNTTFRPAKTVVTVQHLLNFSSGLFYPVVRDNLTGLSEGYFSKEMHAASDPRSHFFSILIGDLPALPLKFEPGTDFVYGWSSDALGFIVEEVSGCTLEEFCKQHIFKPLGMETSFYLTDKLRKRMVDLTYRQRDGTLSPWNGQLNIIEQDPAKVRLHLGGVGMYSSMRDYLKLLRHLLQIHAGQPVESPILKQETVHQMFIPALTDKGSKSISDLVMVPSLQWGTTMAITTEDWPGRRRAGSVFWGGWAGTFHFIDPTSGIAVVFGIQIVPTADMEALKVWSKLEALIYAALIPETPKPNL